MNKHNLFSVDKFLEKFERVLLVGVMLTADYFGADETYERGFQTTLAEMAELVGAAGGDLVSIGTSRRDKPHPALFVGTDKAEELATAAEQHDIGLVVFNHELTPIQEHSLEKELQCHVLNRVGLILAIFTKRVQSQEGKLQVELAQLNHLSGRLVHGYGYLQSQRSDTDLKGLGEAQLEADRHLTGQKTTVLKKQLADVRKQRVTRRESRMSGCLKTLAVVGYANVGKSGLFNCLAKADVLTEDQLLATLDTTTCRLFLSHEMSAVLAGTVDFVRGLSHELVSALSATLEETVMADVLLYAVNASNSDFERQMDDVSEVLEEIGAYEIPQLVVYNKIGLLPLGMREAGILRDSSGQAVGVNISVAEGLDLDGLREVVTELAAQPSA